MTLKRKFAAGCPCCCSCKVIFEFSPGLYNLAFATTAPSSCQITTGNVDDLLKCADLALIGTANACNQWTLQDAAKFKTWLQQGNKRLYVCAEWGPATGGGGGDCLSAAGRTATNNFLAAIGSSISVGTQFCDSGCDPTTGGSIMGNPQAVQIMAGLSGIAHNATCELFGGTAICKTIGIGTGCTSYTFVAGEALFGSMVVVAGDCNICNSSSISLLCTPNTNNFTFFDRLLNSPIGNIL